MKITVTASDAGRIDKVVALHFPGVSRRQLAELFDTGAIRVGGRKAKKGDRVVAGDVLELARTPTTVDDLRPQPDFTIALDIVLERPDFVAIAKPAGIPSQPLRAGELGTVANAIVARFPECREIGNDRTLRDGGLVHRLDIGTSGILIAARTADAYAAFREAFRARRITKTYLAIVDDRPVARECEVPLAQRGNHVVVDYADGLAAQTAFVVERSTLAHSLVRCTAQTGRMHQVRAHLAHVGSPIAGDTHYGGKPVADHSGFFLHAARLVTTVSGEALDVEAPIPDRFLRSLAAVGL